MSYASEIHGGILTLQNLISRDRDILNSRAPSFIPSWIRFRTFWADSYGHGYEDDDPRWAQSLQLFHSYLNRYRDAYERITGNVTRILVRERTIQEVQSGSGLLSGALSGGLSSELSRIGTYALIGLIGYLGFKLLEGRYAS
jgi:hypothetical protein